MRNAVAVVLMLAGPVVYGATSPTKSFLTSNGDVVTLESRFPFSYPLQRFDRLLRFHNDGTFVDDYRPLNIGVGYAPVASMTVTDKDEPIVFGHQTRIDGYAGGDGWMHMRIFYHSTHMVRLKDNGTQDPSFGNNGYIVSDLGETDPVFVAGAVPAKGRRTLVAGTIRHDRSAQGIVAAFGPNGEFDQHFGQGGRVRFSLPSDNAWILSIAWDEHKGHLYVAGTAGPEAFVTRFNDDGSVDEQYGDAGTAHVQVSAPAVYFVTVNLDSSGRTIIAGQIAGSPYTRALLARLKETGRLDHTFGSTGIVIIKDERVIALTSVRVGPDDSIVAGGEAVTPDDEYLNPMASLVRFSADGRPAPGFGTDGVVLTNFGGAKHHTANSISSLVQPDAKVIVTGNCLIDAPTGGQLKCLCLERFNADGSSDQTFGTQGQVRHPIAGNPMRSVPSRAADQVQKLGGEPKVEIPLGDGTGAATMTAWDRWDIKTQSKN